MPYPDILIHDATKSKPKSQSKSSTLKHKKQSIRNVVGTRRMLSKRVVTLTNGSNPMTHTVLECSTKPAFDLGCTASQDVSKNTRKFCEAYVLEHKVDPPFSEYPTCLICLKPLDDGGPTSAGTQVYSFKCKMHWMHEVCMSTLIASPCGSKCPICTAAFVSINGTQPKGTMETTLLSTALPGHSGFGTIMVKFNIPAGKGPAPQRLSFDGIKLCGYLPHDEHGTKICRALQVAFSHNRLFRLRDAMVDSHDPWGVVESEVTFKTSQYRGVNGFPDTEYFDQACMELMMLCVDEVTSILTDDLTNDLTDDLTDE